MLQERLFLDGWNEESIYLFLQLLFRIIYFHLLLFLGKEVLFCLLLLLFLGPSEELVINFFKFLLFDRADIEFCGDAVGLIDTSKGNTIQLERSCDKEKA